MGYWTILLGFVIFVLYYGLQISVLCKGQTIGSRIFKIKIISESGQYLTIGQAILRSILLTPILVFNNVVLPIGYASTIQTMVVICLVLIQVILFFVNKPSRQLLHDLIIKSVCVNKKDEVQSVDKSKTKLILAIVIPIVLCLAAFKPMCNLQTKMFFGMSMQEMGILCKAVKQNTDAKLIGINVKYNKNLDTNKTTSTLIYVVDIPELDVKDTETSHNSMTKIVSVLLKNNEKIKEADFIGVSILKNINLGFYKYYYSYLRIGSLQDWSGDIEKNNPE